MERSDGKKRVLFLGDSLTAGMFGQKGFRHSVLHRRKDLVSVGGCQDPYGQFHEGHPNYTVEDIENLSLEAVLTHRPHWVILLAGSNNLPTEVPEDIVAHVMGLARLISATGVEKVFVSTLPPAKNLETKVQITNQILVKSCIENEQYGIIPVFMGDAVDPTSMLEDECHPTEEGYSAMGRELLRSLPQQQAVGVGEGSGFSTSNEEMAMSAGEFLTLLAEANASATVGASKLGITLSEPVRQIVLAIGLLENGFGQRKSWVLTPSNVPSNNWGALIARPGQPFFDHIDKNRNGQVIFQKFATFPTLADGFADFYQRWANPETLAAANAGDALRTAASMYKVGEFTGISGTDLQRIQNYALSIKINADAVADTLGQPKLVKNVPPLTTPPPVPGNPPIGTIPPPSGPPGSGPRQMTGGGGAVLLLALGAVGAIALLRR